MVPRTLSPARAWRPAVVARLARTLATTSEGQCVSMVTKARPVSTWILMSCGVWLVGLGLYFIFLRPPLLPEDPRFMGTTLEQLQRSVPGLAPWLNKVFVVMGGFMASTGVLTVFMASVSLPARPSGASWAIVLSGVLSVALMSATNFALDSNFQWLLLVPALAWVAGLAFFVKGR